MCAFVVDTLPCKKSYKFCQKAVDMKIFALIIVLATRYWLLATRYWLLATRYSLSLAGASLPSLLAQTRRYLAPVTTVFIRRWRELICLKTLGKINLTSTHYIPSSHTSPLRSFHYSTCKGFLHIKMFGAYNEKITS